MEIERLRSENLQSRCEALTNQINPHFFFNSLNAIASLIRKKDDEKTLVYVEELSDIFRYILQSEHKGVVSLREELDFVEAFIYVMEVRFANKRKVEIKVPEVEKETLRLPVLSILPLIDNVVVHNIIDSEHIMHVEIILNKQNELVVSNLRYAKPSPADTNGTGLNNLNSRFKLLMGKQITIKQDETHFTVTLPLNKDRA